MEARNAGLQRGGAQLALGEQPNTALEGLASGVFHWTVKVVAVRQQGLSWDLGQDSDVNM